MPVEVDILDFKCWNQLRNGDDFSLNTGEFTPNLVGNVGEKVKVQTVARLTVTAFTESVEEWYIDLAQNEIVRGSGSFLDDGIRVGDRYLFYPDWNNRKNIADEYQADVDFISSDGRSLQYSVVTGTATTSGSQSNIGFVLEQTDPINKSTALFLKFGLIGNDETFNDISKVTENQQVYYIGGLNTTPANAESLGTIKDWVTGQLSVYNGASSSGFKGLAYVLDHEFIINPFYILAYRTFIENGTVPALLAGDSSLKYAAELEFRKTLTNTGSSKIKSFDGLGGFVGWYGENFNGLNPAYRIKSIEYEDDGTGDPLDGVNINLSTKVTVTVENVGGAITDYSCGVYLFKIPQSEDEYIGTQTDMLENFLYKSEVVSSPATSSGNVTTSLVSGDLVIEHVIDYSTAEKLRLTTDDEYLLAVQVEDPNISAGDSDRLMLIADFRNYVDVDFLSQFVNVESYGFLGHGQVLGEDAFSGSRVISNEDGILLQSLFGINTVRNVAINSISVSLLAYNPSNGNSFELDRYGFNIGDLVLAGGVQQINIDGTRGYALREDDQFNFAKITTEGVSGDYQQYLLTIGQKTKWQDWINNTDVDDVFFASDKPNNNLNEKTSNYSGIEDYQIHLALIINVSGEDDLGRSITGDYVNYGGVLNVEDYDETVDGVTGVIQTFDLETGNSLNGDILFNGKDTLFKSVFSNALGMDYAIHRIEPSQNQGDGILELSSVEDSVADNLLKPLSGETHLKTTLQGLTLTCECLVDGSLISEGVTYKLSARAGAIPTQNTFEYYFEFILTGEPETDIMVIRRPTSSVIVSLKTDLNGDISFDSEITYLQGTPTAATNLGELVAAAGYADPDGLGAPDNAGVQKWIDIEGNFFLQTSNALEYPEIVNAGILLGFLKFDGSNDQLIGDVGIFLSQKVPDASGGDPGEGFTCTGLAHDATDDTFWMGNDGRNKSGDVSYEPSVVHTSKDGSIKLFEIDMLNISASAQSIQGVTVDTSNATLWVASLNEDKLYNISKIGVDQGGALTLTEPNGLAYDPVSDTLWYCSHSLAVSRYIYEINKTTGAVITTLDMVSLVGAGSARIDHLFIDPDDVHIWMSWGGNGQPGLVARINKSTGSIANVYRFAQVESIEGIFIENENFYILSDAYFHESSSHQYTPENRLFGYNTNKTDIVKITSVFSLHSVPTTVDGIWTIQNSVQETSPGSIGIFANGSLTSLRFFVNPTGVISDREFFDMVVPDMSIEATWEVILNATANTLEIYRDAVQVGTTINLAGSYSQVSLIGAVQVGNSFDQQRASPVNLKSIKIEKV